MNSNASSRAAGRVPVERDTLYHPVDRSKLPPIPPPTRPDLVSLTLNVLMVRLASCSRYLTLRGKSSPTLKCAGVERQLPKGNAVSPASEPKRAPQ